jgi:general stress protein 26
MQEDFFWEQVRAVAVKSERAYLATVSDGRPKVRVVFPAIERSTIWIATTRSSAKVRQIARDPHVELVWEAGARRPTPHLSISGVARMIDNPNEKHRVWNAGLFGYDLAQFWPGGPRSINFALLLVSPRRVELGWQPAMWNGEKPLVWRADYAQAPATSSASI